MEGTGNNIQPNMNPPMNLPPGLEMVSKDVNADQDRFLPIANIGRIMKDALVEKDDNARGGPGIEKDKDAKIAKDARETVQECVSDFISFITSEACEKCINDKRRTINGNDLIYAMRQLGFERYLENIQLYYDKYQETAKKISDMNSTKVNKETKNQLLSDPSQIQEIDANANKSDLVEHLFQDRDR